MSSIGTELNQSMQQVLMAFEQRDAESAKEIMDRLRDLRERGDQSKEICIQILAATNSNTPELRWTGCAHKILSLMDRSSVEIAAIARQIKKIGKDPALPIAENLPQMGRMASEMLERSIQIALHPDAQGARSIMETDSSLDRHKDEFIERAITFVSERPNDSQPVIPYVIVSRHLERIGDHASHIAEEVAYYLQEQAA
jgi:phosphate transport system protein